MTRWYISFLLILLPPITTADSITQTDWSGGWWESGPVSLPDSFFSMSDSISWGGTPGRLELAWKPDEMLYGTVLIASGLTGVRCLNTCDLNQDGWPDVVAAEGASHNVVSGWINPGYGLDVWESFELATLEEVMSIAPLDVDEDGFTDIVVLSAYWLRWYGNPGDSRDQWTQNNICTFPDAPYMMQIGDIDGDDHKDIVVMMDQPSIEPDAFCWLENPGGSGPSWTFHGSWEWEAYHNALHCEDMDGDGDQDLVSSMNYPATSIDWQRNDQAGEAWTWVYIGFAYGEVSSAVSDIDHDGWPDVSSMSPIDGYLKWHRNADGLGTEWEHNLIQLWAAEAELLSADLDADGDQDLAAGSSWFENINASTNLWQRHDCYFDREQDVSTREMAATDIDGDGTINIVVSDPDDIHWVYLVSLRRDSGTLTSSIIYTGCDPHWEAIEWSSEEPDDTGVAFQVRSSDDPEEMGPWSDTLMTPCSLEGTLQDNDSYVQYRCLLWTGDPYETPVLEDVTIVWDPLGLEGETPITEYVLQGAVPNPSDDVTSIRFVLPEPSSVELFIYDLSGRLVSGPLRGNYQQGTHEAHISDLSPSVYICRMVAGEYVGMQRFVVTN